MNFWNTLLEWNKCLIKNLTDSNKWLSLLFTGWLYDGTGSYDVSFIVAGVIVALSGIMLFFIPLVRRCIKTDDDESEDDEERNELTA